MKTAVKKSVSLKHFTWDQKAFTTVLRTLTKEALRLRAFGQACPLIRADEVKRLEQDLRNLLASNPPNRKSR